MLEEVVTILPFWHYDQGHPKKNGYFFTFCLVVLVSSATDDGGLVVTTSHGQIRSTVETTYGGKKVYAFLGIPYGQTTEGEFRFRRPRPVNPWHGVLNATAYPPTCPQDEYPFAAVIPFLQKWQIRTNLSEDCLYLNVWVPISKPEKTSVLIWLYGGAFTKGTISFPLYNGGSLAAEENLIVVAINYRVSVFGFLYLDDEELPGNAGLYDQLLALQWIKSNAKAFGGDPESITLFGESAGAVSAGLLLVSPLNNNIFSRAIMQSGSATLPWSILNKTEAQKRAMGVARYVGCKDGKNTVEIVQCLRTKNASHLLEAEPIDSHGTGVAPVVDNVLVLPNATTKGTWVDRQILLGTNGNEGTLFFLNFFVSALDLFKDKLTINRTVFLDFLKKESPYRDQWWGAVDMVTYLYTDWLNPNVSNGGLDEIISDLYFTCGSHVSARAFASTGGSVYMYRYNHRASYTLFPTWLGVFHSHELETVFGEPLNISSNYSAEDRAFSQQIGHFWANFARTGDPNKSPGNLPMKGGTWPKYTVENEEYLYLSANDTHSDRGLRRKYCVFWEEFLPSMVLKYSQVVGKTNTTQQN